MRYLLAIFVLSCAGCTSGLLDTKQPVQQTYVISAAPVQTNSGPVLPVHVAVARPIPGPGLYSDRIAVLHADRRMDYYSGSRWGVTADVLVQSLLVESLRNTGRLSSVQSDMSAFNAQYLLQTELRDFQAEYATDKDAPTVRVGMVCTLGRIRAREPLAEYSAGAEVRASGNTMQAVIAAFEAAYREAAQMAVDRTMAELATAEANRNTPPAPVPPPPPAPVSGGTQHPR